MHPYVQADLCINNATALYNTTMIAVYVRVDPRLGALVFLVKARACVCLCVCVCVCSWLWGGGGDLCLCVYLCLCAHAHDQLQPTAARWANMKPSTHTHIPNMHRPGHAPAD